MMPHLVNAPLSPVGDAGCEEADENHE